MSKSKQVDGGYIAVARNIFDHLLFKEKRSLSRLEAWLWLVSRAAWKPSGVRRRHGVVHVERGQIAVTERDLARTWQWPKTTLRRFLRELAAEGLIATEQTFGPRIGPETGPELSYPISLITICKYNKFQGVPKALARSADQDVDQKVDQELPFLPTAATNLSHQPILTKESINKELKRSGEPGQREKPHHGAKGRGMVWLDHGTPEWQIYADDFREAKGVEKFPESRIGGRGNWFRWLGEGKQKRA